MINYVLSLCKPKDSVDEIRTLREKIAKSKDLEVELVASIDNVTNKMIPDITLKKKECQQAVDTTLAQLQDLSGKGDYLKEAELKVLVGNILPNLMVKLDTRLYELEHTLQKLKDKYEDTKAERENAAKTLKSVLQRYRDTDGNVLMEDGDFDVEKEQEHAYSSLDTISKGIELDDISTARSEMWAPSRARDTGNLRLYRSQ